MRNPILTSRLLLRDITEADAELLLALDADPEVTKYVGLKQTDLAAYQERIRSTYLAWQEHAWFGIRLVIDRQKNDFLGWVFLRPAIQHMFADELGWNDASELEVGYRFKRETWGKGVATESALPLIELAMTDPTCPAVVGCADHRNLASIKVLHKLGLQLEREVVTEKYPAPIIAMKRIAIPT